MRIIIKSKIEFTIISKPIYANYNNTQFTNNHSMYVHELKTETTKILFDKKEFHKFLCLEKAQNL